MLDLEFFHNQVDIIVGNEQQLKQLQAFDSELSVHNKLPSDSKKYVLYIDPQTQVTSPNYFGQIQWLIQQNQYLDVLKHRTWILFNTENVKLHADRSYWSLNLRPTHGFDDTTWRTCA